jgi:HK97 gp10 family phage protein
MKYAIYITEHSIKEFERQANRLIKDVNESKTRLLLGQARLVRDRIKQKAPLGPTGNLKKAVYASAIPPSLSSEAVAFAGVRPRKAPHAHLVEFGHAGPHPAPPHPFVRPAWDEVKFQVAENIQRGLQKAVERAV